MLQVRECRSYQNKKIKKGNFYRFVFARGYKTKIEVEKNKGMFIQLVIDNEHTLLFTRIINTNKKYDIWTKNYYYLCFSFCCAMGEVEQKKFRLFFMSNKRKLYIWSGEFFFNIKKSIEIMQLED